ncbi:phosphatidylglycerophosphatase A [Kineobactrum sediminis]|uniref:Phosphatidylglycerophosphatase A n=1 Tax=Kineobactrum sediminis TaxID=1905677 RepID=A0A2N5Y012_9GAMM|nr:phosphatidylglycerophosphatase A [Kineobactrum sediminis]PLW81737.1 phosphatidylglycerophosphatase A [Kineobactrum sediminis]
MVSKSDAPVQAPAVFRSPVQFLAFGFGSGLSPKAPGTMGTLVAVPVFLLISDWPLLWYTLFVVVAAVVGVWICGRASEQLNVHDHPGIVWDEFVGYWITMWAMPADWLWIVVGFVVFRIFDIAKPWPIGVLDKNVKGGFGIMVDDILAGVMACITVQIALWLSAV